MTHVDAWNPRWNCIDGRRSRWGVGARSGDHPTQTGSGRECRQRRGRGSGGAAGGGYGNTNEGKIIAAAFMDNYDGVVKVVRNDSSLQRNVGTLKQEAAAGGMTRAGTVFNEGDVLVPKIANIKLLAQPSDTGRVVATLGREELVVIGGEKDGYIKVQSAAASGWIKTVLVTKR